MDNVNYQDIINSLRINKFSQDEYENIINIVNKKIYELTDEHCSTEMYKLLDYINGNLKFFINLIENLHFYKKLNDNMESFNIRFNYNYFIITLSHKTSFCSEFGGISIDNHINIIDTHQETCYNLWGNNMLFKFINILNLETNEDELKKMITLMFKAYQPDKDIKW
jgi:hypothetical protein